MAFQGNFSCNVFKTGLMNGTFDFTSGTFYIALYTNDATLNASTTAYTATGEVVASGYTAGGLALTIAQAPTVGNSGNTAYISFDNAVWTLLYCAWCFDLPKWRWKPRSLRARFWRR
jgi:hypothetical protein